MVDSTWNNATWSVDGWLILASGEGVPLGSIGNAIFDMATRNKIDITLEPRKSNISDYEAKKQSREVLPLTFNANNLLGGVETISSIDVKCYNSENEDITSVIISSTSFTGYKIIINTKQSSAISCKITLKITTSEANLYETDLILDVVDKLDMARVEKQPSEILPIEVDFIKLMNTTESLSSAVFYVVDSLGDYGSFSVIDRYSVEENILKLVLKAGINGLVYNIYIRALTDEGNTYNKQIELTIVEK